MRHTKDKFDWEGTSMPNSTVIPIGLVIREIREARGSTQTALAKKTGIDSRTITAIEKGRIANPSLINLKKIAEALNVNLRDIFGRVEAESAGNLYFGTQRGEFSLDYAKNRFRVVSYLPKTVPFFVGKLVLDSRGHLDSTTIPFPGSVFLQVVLRKLDLILEGKETLLKEGQNVFFDGRLNYSLENPMLRETTAFLITVPSFLQA